MAALNRRGQRRGQQWRRRHLYDTYRVAEDAIVVHNGDQPLTDAIPMLYLHGVLGTPFANAAGPTAMAALAGVIDMGHPVFFAEYSGPNGWGQNDIVDPSGSIDDVLTMAGTLGCRTDQVIIAGESAGSVGAQVWASRNPITAAALFCLAVIPGLNDFYLANPSIQGAIDTAYGNHATYLTELPTHDPSASAVRLALTNMKGRARFDYMIDDELIEPNLVETHAAAIGALAVPHRGTHADGYRVVNPRDIATWLAGVLR